MIKKLFFILTLVIATVSNADSYVIGFKGKNHAFDTQAFYQYAEFKKSRPIIMNATDIKTANQFLDSIGTNAFILYGYSMGAVTVKNIVENRFIQNKSMPIEVITIGAYHTTNVDFTKYNFKFNNYFDLSGKNNMGPGLHLKDVYHSQMQAAVNKLLFSHQ